MKRFCQTLDLKADSALIETYKFWHQSKNIWREIPAGIRAVGIDSMEIYLLGTRLFMILEVPDDFVWDEAFGRLSTMERQAEWEAFVEQFQATTPGGTSSEKWVLMDRIFDLKECE